MTQTWRRHSVFLRFIFSYTILLVILLAVFGVAYAKMRSYTLADAIERERILLEKGQSILDERLREVENIIAQLYRSRTVQEYLNVRTPLSGTAYFRLFELYRNLPTYHLSNNFFSELVVYFPKSNAIVSTFGATADPELFYQTAMTYRGLRYGEWLEQLTRSSSNARLWRSSEVSINGKSNRYVTYSRLISSDLSDAQTPVVLVLVNEQRIFEYFMSFESDAGEYMEIIDSDGMIIAKYGNLASADGRKSVSLSVKSSSAGITYQLTKPLSGLLKQVHRVRNLFLSVSLFAIIVGLCAAVLLAYRNAMPIRRVAAHISAWSGKSSPSDVSEYDVIEDTVSELLSQNSALTTEMERQLPLFRAGCLERLLSGGFSTDSEALAVMNYLDITLDADGYLICAVRIAGHEREVSKQDISRVISERLIARQVIEKNINNNSYIHEKDTDKLILLVSSKDTDYRAKFGNTIARAESELSQRFGIKITCGISDRRTRLVEAHAAAGEAQSALEHLEHHADMRVHWFSSIPKRQMGYFYPLEAESRLYNLVKIGEEVEACTLIDDIIQENFLDRALPTMDIRQLMSEIEGTVCKLRDEILVNGRRHKAGELNDMLTAFTTSASADEFSEVVKFCLHFLCDTVNERKRSHNVELVEGIKKYLDTHYHDPNLTLYMVASHFDLTETYLSQFFKEQTGENYSTYLEKARIGEAKRLLLEEDMSVSDVAQHVGYMINSTFYRAFKRIYGVSPSTYREQSNQLQPSDETRNQQQIQTGAIQSQQI